MSESNNKGQMRPDDMIQEIKKKKEKYNVFVFNPVTAKDEHSATAFSACERRELRGIRYGT